MSDLRRVALGPGQPLPQSSTLPDSSANKKEKPSKNKDIRIEIDIPLVLDNPRKYTEVDCDQLLRKQVGDSQYKEYIQATSGNTSNGKGDGRDDDDGDDVKKLARYFEKKYGSAAEKEVGNACDFYDLGMGYDDEDSFIDNSEAYDELIPSTLDTKHGGFYVNKGKLEFREITFDDSSRGSGSANSGQKRKRAASSSPDSSPSHSSSSSGSSDDEEKDEKSSKCKTTSAMSKETIRRPKIKITPTNAEKAAGIKKKVKIIESAKENRDVSAGKSCAKEEKGGAVREGNEERGNESREKGGDKNKVGKTIKNNEETAKDSNLKIIRDEDKKSVIQERKNENRKDVKDREERKEEMEKDVKSEKEVSKVFKSEPRARSPLTSSSVVASQNQSITSQTSTATLSSHLDDAIEAVVCKQEPGGGGGRGDVEDTKPVPDNLPGGVLELVEKIKKVSSTDEKLEDNN